MANGTQTLAIVFMTAGKQTDRVTDLSQPTTQGQVQSITVSLAAVAQLSVTSFPLFAVLGASEQFSVTAEDAYGNPVLSGFADTIRVAGQSYAFEAKDHGTHVFTTALSTLGPQSLTATDLSNPNVQPGSE